MLSSIPHHLTAVATVAALAISLTGCGSPSNPSGAADPASAGAHLDLTGEWKQSNPNAPDAWQAATIVADTITIYWVSNGGADRALYWAGSVEVPDGNPASFSWQSENDKSKTSSALLASDADSKEFNYSSGVISYEVTALGMTVTVNLEQISSTPAAAPTSGGSTQSDFEVAIKGASFASDYEDKRVIVVDFEFTNNSASAANFAFSVNAQAFQGGIELDSFVIGVDSIDDSLAHADIQPGVTVNVQRPFLLRDDSPVTVEVREFFSFDDTLLDSQEFSLNEQ